MKLSHLRLALPLLVVAFLAPTVAWAQKVKGDAVGSSSSGSTVIPGGTHTATYVITQSGSYVLGGDRIMSDRALPNVEIQAPDVTLDLGGFSLQHPAGSPAAGSGVHLETVENVEIRNGSILNAPNSGVRAKIGKGLRLIHLRIAGSGATGIESYTEDALADHCHVSDSGTGGIALQGKASVVQDCVVTNTTATGIAVGAFGRIIRSTSRGAKIGVWLGQYSTLAESHVGQGSTAGVWVTGLHATIRNNMIANNQGSGVYLAPGVTFVEITGNNICATAAANGLQCGISSSSITNVLAHNRLSANGTNIVGSYHNAGGNVLQ